MLSVIMLGVIMQSVIKLSGIMLSGIKLSVIMLSVIMLSVEASNNLLSLRKENCNCWLKKMALCHSVNLPFPQLCNYYIRV
jgi:hypothetical protein